MLTHQILCLGLTEQGRTPQKCTSAFTDNGPEDLATCLLHRYDLYASDTARLVTLNISRCDQLAYTDIDATT